MTPDAPFEWPIPVADRLGLSDFYTECAAALDEGRHGEWPDFFTPQGLYRIIPRENHELGLPLAVMHCEGQGMMRDRVAAIADAMMARPRSLRRFISGVRALRVDGQRLHAQANVLLVETLQGRMTQILLSARFIDTFERHGSRLLLAERLCVYDSLLLSDSLVEPV
jgi:anthranilate 1,2-dioxygenase small subunit